jgi:hypothetical protein
MVKDVESGELDTIGQTRETPSLSDCWKWLKGLLYDFINLKKQNAYLEEMLKAP